MKAFDDAESLRAAREWLARRPNGRGDTDDDERGKEKSLDGVRLHGLRLEA
jgi:hypothetical protein